MRTVPRSQANATERELAANGWTVVARKQPMRVIRQQIVVVAGKETGVDK